MELLRQIIPRVHTDSLDAGFHHHFDGSASVDHSVHYVMIGVGLVLYAGVVLVLLYKEHRRTGKWRLPK